MENIQALLPVKAEQVSTMTQVGKETTPIPNASIEIVTPFPLQDLQTIYDGLKQYKNTYETPEGFEVLGRGNFGKVFGYKDYAIKFVQGGKNSYRGYDSNSDSDEIPDAHVLKALQSIKSIPRLYGIINDETIIMERVYGLTMEKYRYQMENVEKMDNFISEDFVKEHRDIMLDILMLGYIPKDLHQENVMIDRKTGLPRVIDVGLFYQMSKRDLGKRGEEKHERIIHAFYGAESAIEHAEKMGKYIIEKRFPILLEERKEKILKEDALHKEMREIEERLEEERERKREEERREAIKKFKEEERKQRAIKEQAIINDDGGFDKKAYIDIRDAQFIAMNKLAGVEKGMVGVAEALKENFVVHHKQVPDGVQFRKVPAKLLPNPFILKKNRNKAGQSNPLQWWKSF